MIDLNPHAYAERLASLQFLPPEFAAAGEKAFKSLTMNEAPETSRFASLGLDIAALKPTTPISYSGSEPAPSTVNKLLVHKSQETGIC